MKVEFKVVTGPGAGRAFRIPLPKCLIGRHHDCYLRLRSEAVSRHHCVVYLRDGKVLVRDLNSRNGTYVNGRRVQGDCELHSGDQLQLGPLTVEIQITHKRALSAPVTGNGTQASAGDHASGSPLSVDDGSVAGWVDQADAMARAQRLSDPESRTLELPANAPPDSEAPTDTRLSDGPGRQTQATASSAVETRWASLPAHKTAAGRLPVPEEPPTKDSSEAAAKMLKRFFRRR